MSFHGNIKCKATQEQYEEKSIDILGIKVLYQDKVYFNGENDIVTQEQKDANNILAGGICIFFSYLLDCVIMFV